MFIFVMTAAFGYLVISVLPRHKCGMAVFVIFLGILSYFHLDRMVNDYMGWSIDISGA